MTEETIGHLPPAEEISDDLKQIMGQKLSQSFHEELFSKGSPLNIKLFSTLREQGLEEMKKVEAFLMELYGVTPEEHAEAGKWAVGGKNATLPPGILKTMKPVAVDERFYDLARKHDMFGSTFRAETVAKVIQKQVLLAKVAEVEQHTQITKEFLDGER